jgi:hypothetical protein
MTVMAMITNLKIRDYDITAVPLRNRKGMLPTCVYCKLPATKVVTGYLSTMIPLNETLCESCANRLQDAYGKNKPIPKLGMANSTQPHKESIMSNPTIQGPILKPSQKSSKESAKAKKEFAKTAKKLVASKVIPGEKKEKKVVLAKELKLGSSEPKFSLAAYFRPIMEKGGITIEELSKKVNAETKGKTSRKADTLVPIFLGIAKREWKVKYDAEKKLIIGKK